MLKDIPIEYMDISDQIIQKAKKELKVGIDDSALYYFNRSYSYKYREI